MAEIGGDIHAGGQPLSRWTSIAARSWARSAPRGRGGAVAERPAHAQSFLDQPPITRGGVDVRRSRDGDGWHAPARTGTHRLAELGKRRTDRLLTLLDARKLQLKQQYVCYSYGSKT